jgi:hypothetical protein
MPLAVLAEAALVLTIAVVAGAIIAAVPGGTEMVARLVEELQDPALLGDPQRLLDLALSPAFVVGVVGIAAVAAPLIEEVMKALAISVGGAVVRPDPARAFVWGVASGAGFAIVENAFAGTVAGQSAWLGVVISRLGASVLHAFTGGLVGWAWGQLWSGGTIRRFVACVAGAGFVHGLWNLVAVGIALVPLAADSRSGQPTWAVLMSVVPVAGLLLLGALGLALALALPLVARRLDAQRTLPSGGPAGEPQSGPAACTVPHDDDGRPSTPVVR